MRRTIIAVLLAMFVAASAGCSAQPAGQATTPEVTTQATPLGRP
ncbi:MAG TPA: hypothetical protein PLO19_07575 [Candidatus Cryosericum sp.]|nr:hypothetical protein [Candidatus Cryosericum sp.]